MKLSASIAAGTFFAFACAANAQTTGTTAPAPATAPPQLVSGPPLALAREAADAAIEACRKDGTPISVVIMDETGVLKVAEAADGARAMQIATAQRKANAVLAYKADGLVLAERYANDKQFAAEIDADPKLNFHGGARLIKVGDRIVGVIGISGSSSLPPPGPSGGARDDACAVIGIKQITDRLK